MITDAFSGRAPPRRKVSLFVPGDLVRIRTGELAGLTGVVARLSERFKCILIVDGFPEGIYLRTSAVSLMPVEDEDDRF